MFHHTVLNTLHLRSHGIWGSHGGEYVIFFFWVVTPCGLRVDTSVSEEHAATIFSPEDQNWLVWCYHTCNRPWHTCNVGSRPVTHFRSQRLRFSWHSARMEDAYTVLVGKHLEKRLLQRYNIKIEYYFWEIGRESGTGTGSCPIVNF
jgi:hypothetical protein